MTTLNLGILRRTLGPLAPVDNEGEALAAALMRRAPVAVRLRPDLAVEDLPFAGNAVAWYPRAVIVPPSVRPGRLLEFAAGDYYIQDAGSLLAVRLLDVAADATVCDLCAAPGGKSTAISELLGDRGWLLVNETIHSRLPPLRLNLARFRATRFVLSGLDPERLADKLARRFDAVLVDAPCSGQTLVGRGKQTGRAFDAHVVEHCAARQKRILDAAARLVRAGGILVYSTCTLSVAENEATVRHFLDQHQHWQLDPVPELEAYTSMSPGMYRLWPHRHATAGAFAARLRQTAVRDVLDEPKSPTASARRDRKMRFHRVPLPDEFEHWGAVGKLALLGNEQAIIGWPEWPDSNLLGVLRNGPELAQRKHRDWRPAHALAMRAGPHWQPRTRLVLDDDAARAYLQGAPLPCKQRGWLVATWRGRPLGWGKGDGTWAKNHLPKAARLSG